MVHLFVYGDKAYLPEMAFTDIGMYWYYGPVHMVDMEQTAIVSKICELIEKGSPDIPHPAQSELDRSTSIQKAIGIRSWKTMAKEGILIFALYKRENSIHLASTPKDSEDVQLIDYINELIFPGDTPFAALVERIFQSI